MLAHIELRRTDEIPDVLDQDQIEVGQRQSRQGRAHHRRVQMALAAEAVAGVDQHEWPNGTFVTGGAK